MIYDFQKASLLKRISAFLLDFILVTIIATFIAWIISLITHYSDLVTEFQGYYTQYEEMYGVTLTNESVYAGYTDAQKETVQQAFDAMNADQNVIRCWGLVSTLPIVMVSVGLLISTLLVEFVMPIILKNGQTIGKKVFKLGVVNPNGVLCTNFQLCTRALLGKCVVEYMIPGIVIVMMAFGTLGFVGPIILLILLAAQGIIFLTNLNRPFFHDLISNTLVCDLSTQKTFKTYAEMIAYKEEVNKQVAEQSAY